MMGKQSGQIQMVILNIDSMIPEGHLLRRIKEDMLQNGAIFLKNTWLAMVNVFFDFKILHPIFNGKV